MRGYEKAEDHVGGPIGERKIVARLGERQGQAKLGANLETLENDGKKGRRRRDERMIARATKRWRSRVDDWGERHDSTIQVVGLCCDRGK